MNDASGAQVLLVEDDVGIGRLLERGLTQEGFALCHDDCRSGGINGSAGMIFVR